MKLVFLHKNGLPRGRPFHLGYIFNLFLRFDFHGLRPLTVYFLSTSTGVCYIRVRPDPDEVFLAGFEFFQRSFFLAAAAHSVRLRFFEVFLQAILDFVTGCAGSLPPGDLCFFSSLLLWFWAL